MEEKWEGLTWKGWRRHGRGGRRPHGEALDVAGANVFPVALIAGSLCFCRTGKLHVRDACALQLAVAGWPHHYVHILRLHIKICRHPALLSALQMT